MLPKCIRPELLLPPFDFVIAEPIITALIFVHSLCLTLRSDLIFMFSTTRPCVHNLHVLRNNDPTFLDCETDIVSN